MELDPHVSKYQTSDPLSFAHTSARSRWPNIVTATIDDIHRTVSSLPPDQTDKIAVGKKIGSEVATLKYELQHNRKLTPLVEDGSPDITLYNEELKQREKENGGDVRWHEVEWLFSECYLYRRLANIFNVTGDPYWKAYDYFQRQKMATFKSSRPAVLELAAHYREIVSQVRQSDKDAIVDTADPTKIREAEKILFHEMAEVCLWGNATDLSLLTNITYEDIQKLQGSNARKESEKNILVNDLNQVFTLLDQLKKEGKQQRRVDIVLDNAGFELFVDLILSGYLLATGLATEVVLHPKNIPWFVSDVIPKDFQDLLGAMSDPRAFYEKEDASEGKKVVPLSEKEVEDIQYLFEHWSELHGEGQLILRPNTFWTHSGSFWRMPKIAENLLEDLKESEIVMFKGDLNYRKLVGDVSRSMTPFLTGTICSQSTG